MTTDKITAMDCCENDNNHVGNFARPAVMSHHKSMEFFHRDGLTLDTLRPASPAPATQPPDNFFVSACSGGSAPREERR